jgi:hypothetical protein
LGEEPFGVGDRLLDALGPDGRGQPIDGVGGEVATAVFMSALDGVEIRLWAGSWSTVTGAGSAFGVIPKLGNAARPPSSWPASVS